MGSASPNEVPGVAAFLTPCLLLAATVATSLKQLGLPVGGLSFTVALYLVLDFLLYRLRLKAPHVEGLRGSVLLSTDTPLATPESSDEAVAHVQSQQSVVPAVSERRPQTAVAARAVAASSAPSKGLRLSMPGADIIVNSETPCEFENDFFKGRMLFLLNTSPPDPKWGGHFEGKSRAFEMQIQGKLKRLPEGEVYMGGELAERPKQGLVTQTVSKIVMSFAKQLVKSLHYSFGDKRAASDPESERPHVTFPLYRVMDWFVVTPEAEAPPSLGGDLGESPEDQAARRGGKSPNIVWNTNVTYTMCFHSNTVNFQDWTVINVPGQGSLDLNTFLCKQPVSVVVYDFTAASSSTAHKTKDKSYMYQCTISNDFPGHVARAAGSTGLPPKASGLRSAAGSADPGSAGGESPEGDDSDDGGLAGYGDPREATLPTAVSSDEETDQDGRTSSPPPFSFENSTAVLSISASTACQPTEVSRTVSPGKYNGPAFEEKEGNCKGLVKSGDVLPLLMGGDDTQPSSQSDNGGQATSVAFLGEGNGGGGVAMKRGTAMPAGVQVVKVGGGEDSFRSDYLFEGDAIVLHHPESRKFVRIGRAWALSWSSKASASKIHFVIRGIEGGRPLAHGQPFSLSSRRWSDWEVGVALQPSSKIGGRALGCINKAKRRNTSRYDLLTLVARPWFDHSSGLEGGDAGGVIPALEAEADAITISFRGPFEDVVSADEEEDDDDDEGSDAHQAHNEESDLDEGMSESDPEFDSDLDKVETDRRSRSRPSFSGDGISTKAARAMACYPDNVSSLTVSVPAWVEFLHRERRQGQLAFVVAVQAVPPATPTLATGEPSPAQDVEPGDQSTASPPRATSSKAWTCLRTGRELSTVVTAYRECVGESVAAGTWLSKPRPRVMRHMGTSDQSVRLIGHEISEIQRWESSFRSGDGSKETLDRSTATADIGSSSAVQGDLDADNSFDASSPEPRVVSSRSERATSTADGVVASPPQILRSPGSKGTRAHSESPSPSRTTLHPAEGVEAVGASRSARASSSISAVEDVNKTGAGAGLTVPYRLLCKTVSSPGELDRHFLSGSSASDLGVTVGASTTAPLLGVPVARCLWESHWREEWAALFPSYVACYPPLSKKPVWVLPLKALFKATAVSDERCPFPGLRCLRLETIGRAYYLCFASRSSRDTWLMEILRLSKAGVVDPPSGLELGQDPREMYVLKTTQWRMPPRLILNARRSSFDLPSGGLKQGIRVEENGSGYIPSDGKESPQAPQQQPWELSAKALRSAFGVKADPGNKHLVPFLDLASTFRNVDLNQLDLDSEEALCFFANLYHLIVRHMILVLGPPSPAKEWPSSYAQVSYEVGGDVFSLQELEHCVLRGRLPRPSLKDFPKRFAPLPPEGDDHYIYSLGKADSRMSLFLNNGSQSNPSVVVLLSPGMVDEEMNRACQEFVDYTVKTDAKRRQIRVHKGFQLYAKDLQPRATSKDMIRYGLRFAGRVVIHELSALDVDISQTQIRYHAYLLKCHETMGLLDLSAAAEDMGQISQHRN